MRAGPTDRRLEPAGLGLRWGGSLLDDLVLPAHRWWSRRPRAPHRTIRRARGPERPARPRATERLPTGVAADRAAGGRGDRLDARERDRTGGGAGPDAATRQAGLSRRPGGVEAQSQAGLSRRAGRGREGPAGLAERRRPRGARALGDLRSGTGPDR